MKKILGVTFVLMILNLTVYYSINVFNVYAQGEKGSIICFGDSITKGFRLKKEDSYPYQLGLLLGENVIKSGINGETSTQALERVQRDVISKKPRLVIVQFGGNDVIYRIPLETTLANNEILVDKIQKSGSKAVLLIGEGNLLAPQYLAGFREIAKKKNILLIEDAIQEIVHKPWLRMDGVHPTREGYKIMAEHIYKKIQPLL